MSEHEFENVLTNPQLRDVESSREFILDGRTDDPEKQDKPRAWRIVNHPTVAEGNKIVSKVEVLPDGGVKIGAGYHAFDIGLAQGPVLVSPDQTYLLKVEYNASLAADEGKQIPKPNVSLSVHWGEGQTASSGWAAVPHGKGVHLFVFKPQRVMPLEVQARFKNDWGTGVAHIEIATIALEKVPDTFSEQMVLIGTPAPVEPEPEPEPTPAPVTVPTPEDKSDRTPIATPLLLLLRSRRFWVFVSAILASLIVQIIPGTEAYRDQIVETIQTLGVVLIGGLSLEDGAAALRPLLNELVNETVERTPDAA